MKTSARPRLVRITKVLVGLVVVGVLAGAVWKYSAGSVAKPTGPRPELTYLPGKSLDTSGFGMLCYGLDQLWPPDATLEDVAKVWSGIGFRFSDRLDKYIKHTKPAPRSLIGAMILKATFLNSEGEAEEAYKSLCEARERLRDRDDLAVDFLYSIIYYQAVTALRRGENDNCIACRGQSSCILPIVPAAYHKNRLGSRQAIVHLHEYLDKFPDDYEVRWLLNVAHMTLGEYPEKVDRRYLIPLDHYLNSEFNIGKFEDIGHLVGVNRFNQAGGGIMEDFDNDGLLDLAATSLDPTQPMAFYRNKGDGTFEDRTAAAGLSNQLGGMLVTQTDYNNDGHMDFYISRGAWISYAIRPSLLKNNGDGTFTDVTKQAGLLDPVNSITNSWVDYDNDGWLDLFVCCERQTNRLFHNKRDGTFEEVIEQAGMLLPNDMALCKGATWIDFDNDDDMDVFFTFLQADGSRFFRNNGNGTFTDVTKEVGIDGPHTAFASWAWDYDNDGWLDIYVNSYDRTLKDSVKSMLGMPHTRHSNKLYHNLKGKGFEDVAKKAGLDQVFESMGSNFGDFDNDGYLDMFLGTGDPNLESLVPDRMFRNVNGERFADISASSGTGHLQKGHSVACGDWDRDGDVDIFIQMGGTVNGDRYHNILYNNPGQTNHRLTLKLVGKKSNRPAIGARIKVVTSGEKPQTIYRHISSGSSWGANPLEQHIGLGAATRIATLEIHWPTTKTTQVFHDIDADRSIEITEFATDYRTLNPKPIVLAK